MQSSTLSSSKAEYGIDAPNVIRNFILFGTGLILAGWFIPAISIPSLSWDIGSMIRSGLIWWGASWIASSLLMIAYAKIGKFRHRDKMLSMIEWRGDETVLDIGTGRGLLMIGAAKRLKTGRSYGVDIWNAEDLSNNSFQNTQRNAELEGVNDRIEIRNEDVRKMSFSDGQFDVILSNLCIHNLYVPAERSKACQEIVRVLKRGGTALISDFRHTKDYAEEFRKAGLETELLGPFYFTSFPPLRIVKALKR